KAATSRAARTWSLDTRSIGSSPPCSHSPASSTCRRSPLRAIAAQRHPPAFTCGGSAAITPSCGTSCRCPPRRRPRRTARARGWEVAVALWGDPKQSAMAFALRKYGDRFRVAPAHARKLLRRRYPGEVIGTRGGDESEAAQLGALARLSPGDAAPRQLTQGT